MVVAWSTQPVPQEDLIETVRCTEGDGSSVDLPGHGASGLPEGLTLVEVVELLLVSFVDAAVLRLVADVETRYPELSRHAEDLPKEGTIED